MSHTLQHPATPCNTLQHTATYFTTPYNTTQHPATHCNTLQHTATHTHNLCLHNRANLGIEEFFLEYEWVTEHQSVAVCCSVLQSVAVCCSVWQYVTRCVELYSEQFLVVFRDRRLRNTTLLQCIAVYCSVLQCVAECCSVWQCVTQCVAV